MNKVKLKIYLKNEQTIENKSNKHLNKYRKPILV